MKTPSSAKLTLWQEHILKTKEHPERNLMDLEASDKQLQVCLFDPGEPKSSDLMECLMGRFGWMTRT